MPLTGRRRARPRAGRGARCGPGGRCLGIGLAGWHCLGRRHLRAGALVRRERHGDSRARRRWPLRGRGLRGRRLLRLYLDARCLAVLGRARRGLRRAGWLAAVGGSSGGWCLLPSAIAAGLGCLAGELILKSADYRRLDRRGRGPDKLTHLLELGHHGLALDAELFREFVNPDLRHCAPSTRPGNSGPASRAGQGVLRPASDCAVHRRMLIGRSSQVSLLSSRPVAG